MVMLRAKLHDGPRAAALIRDMAESLTGETPPRRWNDRGQRVGVAHDSKIVRNPGHSHGELNPS